MKAFDRAHFHLGTADEDLDLGILFPKVDGADDGVYLQGGQGTSPNVNALSVHGGRVLDIAVVDLVCESREFRVRAPSRAVDHDPSRRNEGVKRGPKIAVALRYMSGCHSVKVSIPCRPRG